MSSRSFRSVFMVASCAGAALSCYLVSLRVASERAALEDVETQIIVAQRDTRVLQTEIGTRGRLSQLERWNAGAFALSAPAADQFLKGSFELARLVQPERKVNFQAPVVLASAPAPAPETAPIGEPESDDSAAAALPPNALLHEASLKTETREVPARTVVELPQTTATSIGKPATAAKPAQQEPMRKPGLAAAHWTKAEKPRLGTGKTEPASLAEAHKAVAKKSVDKRVIGATTPVTKPIRIAKVDPLAPLPAKHSGNSKDSATER